MKQTKRPARPAAKRPNKAAATRAKQMVRARRPWHKKLLLHPFSVMVLLCAGVLIVGATFRGFAASYNVTATVPAVLPTQPAVIQSPTHLLHLSAPVTTVSGSCPDASYVKLYRNAGFSGAALCSNNTFQIQTSLTSGANELNSQVYNLTDQAGPAATPITVYYDPVVPPSPVPPPPTPEPPVAVRVAAVDNASYSQGAVARASDNPTVSGWAPPLSQVVLTFHSTPQTCITTADTKGWWSCTLDHSLSAGLHHVDIVATTPSGKKLSFPTFRISVVPDLPNILVKNSTPMLLIRTDYQYCAVRSGQECSFTMSLDGGAAPYQLSIDWGDGAYSTLMRGDQSSFDITHKYGALAAADKSYPVIIKATDKAGDSALLQLDIVVKGTAAAAAVTGVNSLFGTVHHWLWVVWPTYAVVVLMALGYYLGEREEYRRLMSPKRTARAGRSGRA